MAEYIVSWPYPLENHGLGGMPYERLVRCCDCKSWSTGIAYSVVGKCKHPDHKGQITNRNYFCANGKEKE